MTEHGRAGDGGESYRGAGVDIGAGYDAVRRIKGVAARTQRPEVLGGIGSFGALFHLSADKWEEPVLVSGADGVGTKLKIAFATGRHDTIGIDLVAYCVNDILCQGAEPLFFLDYLAVGKLAPHVAERIVEGIAHGCEEAGCALIGGETAEMPGMYAPGEYDLAGFAVGAVERDRVIDGSRVRPGDAILGIASTGLQSSGFSLVRRILLERANLPLDKHVDELGRTLGEELLTPTGIYVRPILRLLERFDVRGIANISGGGLPENLPRSLGPGARGLLRRASWPVPPIFTYVQRLGDVTAEEMFHTFNMGMAMTAAVPEEEADGAVAALAESGAPAYRIGEVVAGEPGVDWA